MSTPLRSLVVALVLALAASASACPEDLDGDGAIGFGDLLAMLTAWGPCVACPEDLDGDGAVALGDLLAVLSAWGGPCLESGDFPDMWINGSPGCGEPEPPIQVHRYNDDLYMLRQSLCTHAEAPFMYLIFGEDTVLMQDTGAGNIPIGNMVSMIIDDWLEAHDRTSIDLVVSHSHAHGDHTAGDLQLAMLPNTTVVGTSASAVIDFFGFTDWPNDTVEFDLGGRIIDIVAIPGHHSSHIALYDRRTGLVFTGDTLYPGRLYIGPFATYVASIQRLVDFLDDKPVSHVLGTHIEMTNTPGEDYPIGATHHPDEHELPLDRAHLLELLDAVIAMQDAPFLEVHDDFIVWP